MIPRIRFVVDTDPLKFRWSTPEETARLIQSILRKQLGVEDLDVTVGAMPEPEAIELTCRYTFPLPSWAGEDQMDPCRCDLSEGHDGKHSCRHSSREET